MRLVFVVVVLAIVGASLGIAHTSHEFSQVEERFELTVGVVANGDRPTGAATSDGGTPSNPDGRPAARVVGEPSNDFGVMEKEQSQSHTFVVRNEGDADLHIEKQTVSCSLCVQTTFKSAVVKPGQEVEIDVTLKARKDGPKLSEALEVRTNDKQHEVIRFDLLAYVSAAAGASVSEVTLGDLSTDEGGESKFHVYGFTDVPLEIKQCAAADKPNKPHFDFELRDLTEDELKAGMRLAKSGKEVKVVVKAGLPVGPLEQAVTIVAAVGEEITIHVPVSGKVTGDIALIGGSKYSADRSLLAIGRVLAGEGATSKLHLMVKGAHRDSVKVTVGSCDPAEYLTATIGERKPIRNGMAYLIPLTVNIDKDTPPMNRLGGVDTSLGEIMLQTTHPTAKEVRLRVRFAVE